MIGTIKEELVIKNNGDEFGYGTMIADPWQDKGIIETELISEKGYDNPIKLMYLDIPLLHEFNKEGNQFFELLANTD